MLTVACDYRNLGCCCIYAILYGNRFALFLSLSFLFAIPLCWSFVMWGLSLFIALGKSDVLSFFCPWKKDSDDWIKLILEHDCDPFVYPLSQCEECYRICLFLTTVKVWLETFWKRSRYTMHDTWLISFVFSRLWLKF